MGDQEPEAVVTVSFGLVELVHDLGEVELVVEIRNRAFRIGVIGQALEFVVGESLQSLSLASRITRSSSRRSNRHAFPCG